MAPTITVMAKAAMSSPGEDRIRSRCRKATHGMSGSDHPMNPSMYMLTGAILSLQNALVLPPARAGVVEAPGACEWFDAGPEVPLEPAAGGGGDGGGGDG